MESARFTDNNDGTITDHEFNLMWAREDSWQTLGNWLTWDEAKQYAQDFNNDKFAGFQDWRLPYKYELEMLYDASKPNKDKYNKEIGLGRWMIEQKRCEHSRRVRRESGDQGSETQKDRHSNPEEWPRSTAHETGKNRFTGVQRIASSFDVVKHLEHDRDRGNPHQTATIAGGNLGSHQPLAPANLNAAHHDPRPDQPRQVSPRYRLRFRQIRHAPSREAGIGDV